MTLLPHCDAVFVHATAALWVPFAKLALVPEFGSSITFHELLGRAVATDVLLAGRRLSSTAAVAHGIATRVVEGDVLEEVTSTLEIISFSFLPSLPRCF